MIPFDSFWSFFYPLVSFFWKSWQNDIDIITKDQYDMARRIFLQFSYKGDIQPRLGWQRNVFTPVINVCTCDRSNLVDRIKHVFTPFSEWVIYLTGVWKGSNICYLSRFIPFHTFCSWTWLLTDLNCWQLKLEEKGMEWYWLVFHPCWFLFTGRLCISFCSHSLISRTFELSVELM